MAYFRQSKRRTALFLETLLNQPCCPALTLKMQTQVTEALRPVQIVSVVLHRVNSFRLRAKERGGGTGSGPPPHERQRAASSQWPLAVR
jgi:hypothetical protein